MEGRANGAVEWTPFVLVTMLFESDIVSADVKRRGRNRGGGEGEVHVEVQLLIKADW